MKSNMYGKFKFKFKQGKVDYARCVAPKQRTKLVFVTAQYKPGSPRAGTTQLPLGPQLVQEHLCTGTLVPFDHANEYPDCSGCTKSASVTEEGALFFQAFGL